MSVSINDINYAVPTPDTLRDLCQKEGGPLISIYLPVPREPPESDKTPVLLKNLLRQVRHRLEASGIGPQSAEDRLRPLHELVENPKQFLKGHPSLAFFIAEDRFSAFRLPYPVEAQAEVGNRFQVKPILDLFTIPSPVTVVCLNRGHVRTMRGIPLQLEEIEVKGMPRTLTDVTGIDDPEKSIQQHTGKVASAKGRPGTSPVMQTHGQGLPADLEHSQLKRFFTEVAKALESDLASREDVLVVFGLEKNIGLFKSAFDPGKRTVHLVDEDPQNWEVRDLQERTAGILDSDRRRMEEANLRQLESLHEQSEGLFNVKEAALAAATGRIDMVVVATNHSIPGVCNPDDMTVEFGENSEPGAGNDLLDYIATETIRHGGTVSGAPFSSIPGGKGVAAKTRF